MFFSQKTDRNAPGCAKFTTEEDESNVIPNEDVEVST